MRSPADIQKDYGEACAKLGDRIMARDKVDVEIAAIKQTLTFLQNEYAQATLPPPKDEGVKQ